MFNGKIHELNGHFQYVKLPKGIPMAGENSKALHILRDQGMSHPRRRNGPARQVVHPEGCARGDFGAGHGVLTVTTRKI